MPQRGGAVGSDNRQARQIAAASRQIAIRTQHVQQTLCNRQIVCKRVYPRQLASLLVCQLQSWIAQPKGLVSNLLVALSVFAADKQAKVPTAEGLDTCRLSICYTMQDIKQHSVHQRAHLQESQAKRQWHALTPQA
jgi:hypothetical protein